MQINEQTGLTTLIAAWRGRGLRLVRHTDPVSMPENIRRKGRVAD
ncbi:hypothetical protein [Paraburkholderia dioscoreae]|uniref:Uncharacterized protein n=1 Tax=Paraburkholderia dioscoreae TaxID=2604047 RepID=A0A5Q4ZCJ4_9BURK|nr:hypothetical protein [Paraburkholderia dioscoreae]VVD32879.1 protein of unknown function [Paraburkholderia dioscoreae]